MRLRIRHVPGMVTDVLACMVAIGAALGLLIAAGEVGARPPDILGMGLLALAGAPLLVRRRWPVAAFGATLVVVLTYLSLDYPGGAELPIILLGLYGISSAGHRWWTAALAGVFVGVGTVYRIQVEGDEPLSVTVGAALFLLTALLGDSVHARRALRAETRERLRAAEAEKETLARARVAEERLRIAHELHDVMAHTITTMSVQAGAAADLLEHRPERAQEPLQGMRRAARESMLELRAIIRLLRDPDPHGRTAQPRLDQVGELVAGVRHSGLDVELLIDGDPATELPAAVDLTAYRIVQEALTNVIRHADADHAHVRLTYQPTHLRMQISDDGRGGGNQSALAGYGLRGLRERADALGGSLEAGPRPEGGFRVDALLPSEAKP